MQPASSCLRPPAAARASARVWYSRRGVGRTATRTQNACFSAFRPGGREKGEGEHTKHKAGFPASPCGDMWATGPQWAGGKYHSGLTLGCQVYLAFEPSMVLEQEPRTRRAGKLSDAGQGFT
eukprot:scaffold32409_cov112-Isochrysis_galbana.AAC.4